MTLVSGLYLGAVTHQRFAPRRHRMRYDLFQMLLDLDEAPILSARLRWFSLNRFNLLSFHDRDHGDGRSRGLRGWVDETLAAAGLPWRGGKVRLLCMPRLLGHVFNPLSIYYCHGPGGELTAMLYEVNNTFGERHSYLIPVPPGSGDEIRQSCAKAFYVSPFMDMDMRYDFRLTLPRETVTTAVRGAGPDGAPLIVAIFQGQRAMMTDAAVIRVLAAFPFLTLKVVAAIHLEAFKLAAKGLRLRRRPTPPGEAVTVA